MILLLTPSLVTAGGFQLHEQNASVGDVHAGYAVDSHDASVSFYNSAGLTEILEAKTTTSAVTVANYVSFKGETSIETFPTNSYPAVTNSGEVSTKGIHVIPSLHYATPINNQYAFGLSIASPFAAELSWSNKDFTRYNTTTNGIKAINFSPSLAYKTSDQLSFGLGADIQYVSMQIDKIVGSNIDLSFNNQSPSVFDSNVTNNLSNTGLGWHGGVLYKPSNNLKLGLNYRSAINHYARGESILKGKLAGWFEDPSPNKVNRSKNLKAVIRIPQTIAFSASVNPITDWDFVSTVMYTNWAVVESFDLKNVPTAFADPDTQQPIFLSLVKNPLHLRNTYTFLNGIHWHYSDRLLLKSGLGYDQTPTVDRYRDLKMPDGNRYLFGLGANYKYNRSLNLEFGWMFVKIGRTKIDHSSIIPPAPIEDNSMNPGEKNEIRGSAKGSAHVIGMQFTASTADMYGYAYNKLSKLKNLGGMM